MTTVEKIKAKILDLAIRGKLVPQDPSDEPASVLLERVKAEKAELVKARKIKKEKNPSEIVIGSDGVPYEKFQDGTKKDLADEIPFELPQGWALARLKDLGEFVGGHTPSLADKSNWDNGSVLWVTSKDMKQKYIRDTGYKLSPKGAGELRLLPAGTLLMVTRSGILRRTFPIALAANELTINQDQRALIFHNNEMGEFVYFMLKGMEHDILKNYRKTGTTVESIIWERFINMIISLPPFAEQNRIVTRVKELFAYADKIEDTSNGVAATSQRLDKKILDLAIKGQLVSQSANDEPAGELLKRIHASKEARRSPRERRAAESIIFRGSDRLAYETVNGKTKCIQDEIPFDIPDSWAWARLGTVLMPMETKLPREEWFDYIDIDAIDNNHNVVLSPKRLATTKAPSRASRGLEPGDTLFSVVRPYLRNIAYVDESLSDCIASTGFYVCRPCEINSRFLFCLLLSDYVVNGINAFMKGDNSPSVRTSHIQNLPVPIPPLAEQRRIAEKVEQLKTILGGLKT